jgi:hypothetical protein
VECRCGILFDSDLKTDECMGNTVATGVKEVGCGVDCSGLGSAQ